LIYDNGTSVGIGTNNPSYTLEVNGGVFASNYLSGQGTWVLGTFSGNASIVGFGSSGNGAITNTIQFNTNTSEKMRITQGGNVGIGTTSPSYLLDVNGQVRFTGQVNLLNNNIIYSNAASGHTYHQFNRNTATGWEQMIMWSTGGTPKWYVGLQNNTSDGFSIYGAAAGANAITILSTNRVGIGTTSPSGFLHIKGGNNNSLYVDNDGSQYTPIYVSNNGSVKGFLVWDNTSAIFQLGAASSNPLAFYTNSAERMRISETKGQLLIGTSTTSGFDKAVVMNSASSTSGLLFQLNGVDKGFVYSGGGDLFMGSNSNTIQLYTNGTERMRVTSGGNVGIGTTSPGGKLVVVGASSNTYIAIDNVGSGENYFGANSFHNFQTAGVERMRILSSGDVAIGTTSSGGYKLAVNGSFNAIGNVTSTGSGAGLFTQSRDFSAVMGWYSENTTYLYYYHGTHGVTARITGSSGAYTALSDINKKKDIEESRLGLEAIKLLKPKTYRFKSESDSASKSLGFIAQEVKEAIPQAYSEDGDFIGLSEMPIIATLVNAVKELSAKVELLEAK
jgi:hypothetical protein